MKNDENVYILLDARRSSLNYNNVYVEWQPTPVNSFRVVFVAHPI